MPYFISMLSHNIVVVRTVEGQIAFTLTNPMFISNCFSHVQSRESLKPQTSGGDIKLLEHK